MKLSTFILAAIAAEASGKRVSVSSGGKARRRRRHQHDLAGSDAKENSMSLAWMEDTSSAAIAKLGKSAKSAKSSKSLKEITATITKPGPPGCYDVAFACTSEKLLEGVGLFELPGRSFPPFTTDGCPDGTEGDYLEDESVEQITVSAVDGDKLQAGRMAKIEAIVHAYNEGDAEDFESDRVHFFYADNVENPTWKHIESFIPSKPGLNTLAVQYRIPEGSGMQAVRVSIRYGGPINRPPPCDSRKPEYTDHDDLIFAVATAEGTLAPTGSPITYAPTNEGTFADDDDDW
eukprot:CAMPEP_0181110106 /NCGR_PEP_ID=MMETSP1071-20121207/18537_1 /TAXON_ID=35127 /ORGANISM="Thalassiosira sp., Strain NH16" /LENGTH=289 /DNA_ID=CAMNT_0023193855 /DNA_START=108 /DNA_END=977 /DNA_ORIENTATION=-